MPRYSLRKLLIVMLLGGCSGNGPKVFNKVQRKPPVAQPKRGLPENPADARSQLLSEIPIGTAMDVARKRFSAIGFQVYDGSEEFVARLDKPAAFPTTCSWIVTTATCSG